MGGNFRQNAKNTQKTPYSFYIRIKIYEKCVFF